MRRWPWFAAAIMVVICSLGSAQEKKSAPAPNEKQAPAEKKPAPKAKEPDDRLMLTVVTRTGGTNKFARADKIQIFVLINGDREHKHRLFNPKKNNFELGATDTFANIPIDMPLEKIESIRLAAEGDDMWKCETISFQFFQKELKSRLYKFNPARYVSAAKEKKAFASTPSLDFKLTVKPVLAPPEAETKKP